MMKEIVLLMSENLWNSVILLKTMNFAYLFCIQVLLNSGVLVTVQLLVGGNDGAGVWHKDVAWEISKDDDDKENYEEFLEISISNIRSFHCVQQQRNVVM